MTLEHIAPDLRALAIEIDQLHFDPNNARAHPERNLQAICASLRRFGQRTPLVVQRTDEGQLVVRKGNGTLEAARRLIGDGDARWRFLAVVVIEEDSTTATSYAIADNRTGELAQWDEGILLELLEELEDDPVLFDATGFDEADLDSLYHDLDQLQSVGGAQTSKEDMLGLQRVEITRMPRLFYTCSISNRWMFVLAKASGWELGTQSSKDANDLVAKVFELLNLELDFIDNDYHDYDHDVHADFVRRHRPWAATTRDIMTRAQCEAAGVEYYPLEQILDWAAQLETYCERVILIPKHDVIDQIPERYILGYSVASSYGGTPLPYERFAGRDVHLLGGSWDRQLDGLARLGDDIVSLDNNYVMKMASFGQIQLPHGSGRARVQDLFEDIESSMPIALMLSLGSMKSDIKEALR